MTSIQLVITLLTLFPLSSPSLFLFGPPHIEPPYKQFFMRPTHPQLRLPSQHTEMQETNQQTEIPFIIKAISLLGLEDLLIDRLIFKRRDSKYSIQRINGKNRIVGKYIYEPPTGYVQEVEILQDSSHSVPVIKITPPNIAYPFTIVYAHGNSSDLYDSLLFVERMTKVLSAQFIIFDYTGYGCSKVNRVTQKSICEDIELVLAWAERKTSISDIILWGFSLGTFPVLHCAAKYSVQGVILQSPLASVSCMFVDNLHKDIKFEEDYFCNLDLIHRLNCEVMILHSLNDDVIPYRHACLLFEKYAEAQGYEKIQFLEVENLKHNGMHSYLCSSNTNKLRTAFIQQFDYLKWKHQLAGSQASSISRSSNKTKLKVHPGGSKMGGETKGRKNMEDLSHLYDEMETRSITEVSESDFEVVVENGVKKVTRKKIPGTMQGCSCL